MEIIENKIKVIKTGRYFTKRSGTEEIRKVLFVIHGYAQLAADFINEFEFPDNENTLIIAPEGLSKFYSRNKIGASWMTKDCREDEIEDYVLFLDSVFNEIMTVFNIKNPNFNLLGFSQGVHTAVRWFVKSRHNFNNLILFSSDFPADVNFQILNEKTMTSKVFYISGNNDDVIGKYAINKSISLLNENNIRFTEINFDGGHEINQRTLKEVLKKF